MRNWPSENFVPKTPEKQKVNPQLSETQKNIVDRVLTLLQNPEANKKVSENFAKNYENITHNPEMLQRLIDKIQSTMKNEISQIWESFQWGKIDQETKKTEWTKIITKYTKLQLSALQNSLE